MLVDDLLLHGVGHGGVEFVFLSFPGNSNVFGFFPDVHNFLLLVDHELVLGVYFFDFLLAERLLVFAILLFLPLLEFESLNFGKQLLIAIFFQLVFDVLDFGRHFEDGLVLVLEGEQ